MQSNIPVLKIDVGKDSISYVKEQNGTLLDNLEKCCGRGLNTLDEDEFVGLFMALL